MSAPAKTPWINPDLTFKGAVLGLLALLAAVAMGVLLITLGVLFAWALLTTTYGRLFIAIAVIAVVGAAIKKAA